MDKKIKEANEIMYQEWKLSCKKSIEAMSAKVGISKLELVRFAYRYYPKEYKTSQWIRRIYKELKVEYG